MTELLPEPARNMPGGIPTTDVALRERSSIELVIRVVNATPAPQGSFFAQIVGKGPSRRAIVVADNKHTAPWRKAVTEAADSAKLAADWLQLNDAAEVEIVFWLPRPASVSKARLWPAVRPDLDKYVRSTFDALTAAHVIADDSRIVRLVAEKRYCEPGQPTGARIRVAALSRQEALL